MTEYHKKKIEKKLQSIASWRKQPLKREEYLSQFKRLREQRFARESKLQG